MEIHMRNQSYLMMLGDTYEVQQVIQKHNYPIKPIEWYDQPFLMQAIAAKYD